MDAYWIILISKPYVRFQIFDVDYVVYHRDSVSLIREGGSTICDIDLCFFYVRKVDPERGLCL